MPVPSAQQLASYTFVQQHPITHAWAGSETRRALLAEEHQLDVDMVTDLEFARHRRDRFAPDQQLELFLNSWQEVRPGLSIMLSMRYEGGDPGRPFVEASALSRLVVDAGEIAAMADAAWVKYGVLTPDYLRWWSQQSPGAIPGTSQDRRFLAAPLTELAGQPAPANLILRPSPDLAHYGHAVAAYSAVDHDHPDHPHQAQIESRNDLEDLRLKGLLFDVLLDDQWSGYVAAEQDHKLGLAGYTVAELILTEGARGRQLGRFLTTRLAQALVDCDPDGVLIGSIHHHNTGALRAAKLAGRHDIGGRVICSLRNRH